MRALNILLLLLGTSGQHCAFRDSMQRCYACGDVVGGVGYKAPSSSDATECPDICPENTFVNENRYD